MGESIVFQPCTKTSTASSCQTCPVNTFMALDDNWGPCKMHTSCPEKHRTVHAVGNAVTDNTCGACLAGSVQFQIHEVFHSRNFLTQCRIFFAISINAFESQRTGLAAYKITKT